MGNVPNWGKILIIFLILRYTNKNYNCIVLKIPFGEVNVVRGYLKVDGKVLTPEHSHPQRPVEGLNCKRSEVSGKRLWDLFIELSEGDPYKFFKHSFIHNYFPLALMNKNAKNITPAELKVIFKYYALTIY